MPAPTTPRLAGKVALVTDASRGIGQVIAEHMAAEGAAIAINYIASEAAANAVVARIRAAGGTAEAIQGDVSQVAAAAPLIAETIRASAASTCWSTTPRSAPASRLTPSPRPTSTAWWRPT